MLLFPLKLVLFPAACVLWALAGSVLYFPPIFFSVLSRRPAHERTSFEREIRATPEMEQLEVAQGTWLRGFRGIYDFFFGPGIDELDARLR